MEKKKRKVRRWTMEEEDDLAEMWGRVRLDSICKKLGRTPISIKGKVVELGLGKSFEASDKITVRSLAVQFAGLKRSANGITKKWIKAGLKTYDWRVNVRSYKMTTIDDFWDFAEMHKNLVDFYYLPKGALGTEPAWVKDKRLSDANKHRFQYNRKWTDLDTTALKHYATERGLTATEIAAKLNRSPNSVYMRAHKLGIKLPRKKYTELNYINKYRQTIDAMIHKGYTKLYIADTLNINHTSLVAWLTKLYGTNDEDKIREIIHERRRKD